MKRALLFALVVLLSGCTSSPPPSTTTPPTTSAAPPSTAPPVQLYSAIGNNDQCSEVLTGEHRGGFTLTANHSRIEIDWHAVGLGEVGYEITGPDGFRASKAKYNPNTPPPCAHAHGEGGDLFDAKPGNYTVVVTNTGPVGWQLVVVARGAVGNGTHGHATFGNVYG